MDRASLIKIVRHYSCIDAGRLDVLYTRAVSARPIAGAIVQCGVFEGGSAALLWHACGGERDLYLFDSFQGMPAPDKSDGERAVGKWHKKGGGSNWCRGSIERVKEVLGATSVPVDKTHIVAGWFKDTLPIYRAAIPQIAFLHVDADWYASTQIALDTFWPALVPGGVCVIDDYGTWPGCRQAVDEFVLAHNLRVVAIDKTAVVLAGKNG